jgi:formylmethanofuran dehydrogenase subunit E
MFYVIFESNGFGERINHEVVEADSINEVREKYPESQKWYNAGDCQRCHEYNMVEEYASEEEAYESFQE